MRLVAITLLLLLSSLALASEVVVNSYAFIEVPDGDETVKVPVTYVDPGDIVLMSLSVENRSDEVAERFEIDNPVPEQTLLLSVEPTSFATFVGRGNGPYFPIEQVDDMGSMRAIRWQIPSLAPGQSLTLNFRIRVDSDQNQNE